MGSLRNSNRLYLHPNLLDLTSTQLCCGYQGSHQTNLWDKPSSERTKKVITFAARLVRKINDKDAENQIKFIVEIGEGKYDEILTYNELSNYIEVQQDNDAKDKRWTFSKILDHQGPIPSTHKDYNGSAYNVLVEWDNGTQTYEPLDIMIKDDPITLAIYAPRQRSPPDTILETLS